MNTAFQCSDINYQSAAFIRSNGMARNAPPISEIQQIIASFFRAGVGLVGIGGREINSLLTYDTLFYKVEIDVTYGDGSTCGATYDISRDSLGTITAIPYFSWPAGHGGGLKEIQYPPNVTLPAHFFFQQNYGFAPVVGYIGTVGSQTPNYWYSNLQNEPGTWSSSVSSVFGDPNTGTAMQIAQFVLNNYIDSSSPPNLYYGCTANIKLSQGWSFAADVAFVASWFNPVPSGSGATLLDSLLAPAKTYPISLSYPPAPGLPNAPKYLRFPSQPIANSINVLQILFDSANGFYFSSHAPSANAIMGSPIAQGFGTNPPSPGVNGRTFYCSKSAIRTSSSISNPVLAFYNPTTNSFAPSSIPTLPIGKGQYFIDPTNSQSNLPGFITISSSMLTPSTPGFLNFGY